MANISFIAMALRKDSFNKKLISNAHRLFKENQGAHTLELLSFNDFPMPVYDGDIETQGIPAGVIALASKISASDAVIISTPEYNGSIPGSFKNAIDWVSRVKPMPWAGKNILLMGASPGALGAVRGLLHARQPLDICGAFVFPETMGLPKANEAFDEAGNLKEAALEERLRKFLGRFKAHIEK